MFVIVYEMMGYTFTEKRNGYCYAVMFAERHNGKVFKNGALVWEKGWALYWAPLRVLRCKSVADEQKRNTENKRKEDKKMLAIAIFLAITIVTMVTYIGFVIVEGE